MELTKAWRQRYVTASRLEEATTFAVVRLMAMGHTVRELDVDDGHMLTAFSFNASATDFNSSARRLAYQRLDAVNKIRSLNGLDILHDSETYTVGDFLPNVRHIKWMDISHRGWRDRPGDEKAIVRSIQKMPLQSLWFDVEWRDMVAHTIIEGRDAWPDLRRLILLARYRGETLPTADQLEAFVEKHTMLTFLSVSAHWNAKTLERISQIMGSNAQAIIIKRNANDAVDAFPSGKEMAVILGRHPRLQTFELVDEGGNVEGVITWRAESTDPEVKLQAPELHLRVLPYKERDVVNILATSDQWSVLSIDCKQMPELMTAISEMKNRPAVTKIDMTEGEPSDLSPKLVLDLGIKILELSSQIVIADVWYRVSLSMIDEENKEWRLRTTFERVQSLREMPNLADLSIAPKPYDKVPPASYQDWQKWLPNYTSGKLRHLTIEAVNKDVSISYRAHSPYSFAYNYHQTHVDSAHESVLVDILKHHPGLETLVLKTAVFLGTERVLHSVARLRSLNKVHLNLGTIDADDVLLFRNMHTLCLRNGHFKRAEGKEEKIKNLVSNKTLDEVAARNPNLEILILDIVPNRILSVPGDKAMPHFNVSALPKLERLELRIGSGSVSEDEMKYYDWRQRTKLRYVLLHLGDVPVLHHTWDGSSENAQQVIQWPVPSEGIFHAFTPLIRLHRLWPSSFVDPTLGSRADSDAMVQKHCFKMKVDQETLSAKATQDAVRKGLESKSAFVCVREHGYMGRNQQTYLINTRVREAVQINIQTDRYVVTLRMGVILTINNILNEHKIATPMPRYGSLLAGIEEMWSEQALNEARFPQNFDELFLRFWIANDSLSVADVLQSIFRGNYHTFRSMSNWIQGIEVKEHKMVDVASTSSRASLTWSPTPPKAQTSGHGETDLSSKDGSFSFRTHVEERTQATPLSQAPSQSEIDQVLKQVKPFKSLFPTTELEQEANLCQDLSVQMRFWDEVIRQRSSVAKAARQVAHATAWRAQVNTSVPQRGSTRPVLESVSRDASGQWNLTCNDLVQRNHIHRVVQAMASLLERSMAF